MRSPKPPVIPNFRITGSIALPFFNLFFSNLQNKSACSLLRHACLRGQFGQNAILWGKNWQAKAKYARLTDERPILDESVKQEISDLLQLASTDSNLVLNIVYFVPDTRKAGGTYMEITGHIKKLIPHEKLLILDTGPRIPVEDIVEVTVQTR